MKYGTVCGLCFGLMFFIILGASGPVCAQTNGNFEGGFTSGVANNWIAWNSQGGAGTYKASGTCGRIGGGAYGTLNNALQAVQTLNGKTTLLMDGGLSLLATVKSGMPDTIFVGRLFIPDQGSYVNDPVNKGILHANNCAAQQYQPTCWMGLNEPGVGSAQEMAKVAIFEKSFTDRLHELGLQSCVFNLAVGNPGDWNLMELQEVRDCLAVADYVGYHTYGSDAEELMGGLNGQGNDYPWYALRWRMYRNTYDSNGWRMPPVIYTECTTWSGWKGYFTAQQVLDDLKWMRGQMINDPWSTGMCIFLSGYNGDPQWLGWEVANEPTILNGANTDNASYSADAKSGKAQIFGNSTQIWKGGINQAVATTSGHQYRFKINYKWEYLSGVFPNVSLRLGYDPTGQTSNGTGANLVWSGNLNTGVQAIHETWRTAEVTFTASSSNTSFWIEGYQSTASPNWRICVDDVTVTDLSGAPTSTPAPTNTPTRTPTQTPVPTNTPPPCSERVTNGNFSSGSTGWTNWTQRGSATRNFSSSNIPSGGTSPCLEMSSTSFNGGVYQALSLVNGQNYTISVKTRDVGSAASAAWCEVLIGTAQPVAGSDYTVGSPAGTTVLQKWDTWTCDNWNGTNGCVTNVTSFTASAATMYLVLKCGQSGSAVVDVSYDNVSVCGSAPAPTSTPTPTNTPTRTPTPTPTNTPGGPIVSENFETMPSWTTSFDAAWGGQATWSIVAGGQSGNALQVVRTNDGSSAKVKVYSVPSSTNITVSGYMRSGSGTSYWAEFAYKLGNYSAQDFDNNSGTWTMVKKFSNSGTNGNGNVWTNYSVGPFGTGANTQISIGYKLGRSVGTAPTVQWDTFRIQ